MNHQRQLAVCIMVYAQDHNDILPLPDDWLATTRLRGYSKIFNCPTNKHQGTPTDPDYGMNAFLYETDVKTGEKCGMPLKKIDDPTIIELTADINGPAGAKSHTLDGRPINLFPKSYTVTGYFGEGANADWRHGKSIVVTYVDGHVTWVRPERLTTAGRTRYNIPIGEKPAVDYNR